MKNSRISVCSIVRDCQKNLVRNIPRIESLRKLFLDSEVIIFENDSKDGTLETLKEWQQGSKDVHIFSEQYNKITIPGKTDGMVNPFFSLARIEKMVMYRNKYLDFLNKSAGPPRDFVIVVDLDIAGFSLYGVINSFGTNDKWDCIAANGVSLSSRLTYQYHDSYALIEAGKMEEIQTEKSITFNRKHFSFLKPGMPLLEVDSAYGGLAIYNWESIKGLYYFCPLNEDPGVQCKSEHVGLHSLMKKNGHGLIYVNPSMLVKYRSVTWRFLINKMKENFMRLTWNSAGNKSTT